MKKIIYISGLVGVLLLLLRALGFVFEIFQQDILVYVGLAILLFINLPFYLTGVFLKARRRHRLQKEDKAMRTADDASAEVRKDEVIAEAENQEAVVEEYEKVQ